MSSWHSKPLPRLLEELDARPGGLSQHQAEERLRRTGPNELEPPPQAGLLGRLLEQMRDPMILVLLGAAGLSLAASGGEEWLDAAIILVIVAVNSVISIFQEDRAQHALEELRRLSAPQATVLRGGRPVKLPAAQLVPGDAILLEAGDLVPADARILECSRLQADESAMTGESIPVEKAPAEALAEGAPLGDWTNMVISGTLITAGRGTALVCATGMDTQMGHIAGLLLGDEGTDTPLQQKMGEISRTLSFLCLSVCAVMFGVGLIQGKRMLDMFLTAVSLAVAAIPEGLPAIVTIVLALGVGRMAARGAIVKKLPAVETLGCAGVICSDKTGTLTQNRMTPQTAYVDGSLVDCSALTMEEPIHRRLIQTAILASDATTDEEKGTAVGDPTEVALIMIGDGMGIEERAYREQYPRLCELAFDSDRKLMSTLHVLDGGETVMLTKGALDVLLEHSTQLLTSEGVVELTDQRREQILAVNQELSSKGLRVLAFAYRDMPGATRLDFTNEREYTFIGLISMIDPPRPEAIQAVADAKRGGIRTVMITGDHRVTASAIAKEIGILTPGTEAVEGAVIESMSDEELREFVPRVSVYARVSPEHKIRIVRAWQERGNLVAMTGDGVNDAPALKVADIGCAMGVTGTDVAKGAADMILTDDNFATIVSAVEQGRGIYANIKKAIHYLLSCNIGEILTIFCATVFHFHQMPLVPVQLLWLNLVTDSLPALALGVEPVEEGVMSQPPRDAHASLFAHGFAFRLAWQGVMVGLLTLAAYFLGEYVLSDPGEAHAAANTMAFATLTLCQLFHAFDVRSERSSLFHIGVFSNPAMNKAFLIGLTMQLAVLCVPPLQVVFSTVPMSPLEWAVVLALAITPVVVCELAKAVSRGRTRRPARAEKVEPACARR